MTAKERDKKLLESTQVIMDFMWNLTSRYSAEDIRTLARAEKLMEQRYGIVFVADAITKDRNDAELAMFRYAKNLPAPEPASEHYIEVEAPQHREYRAKRYGAHFQNLKELLGAGVVFTGLFFALTII